MEFIYALLTILMFMTSIFIVVFALVIGTNSALLQKRLSKEEIKVRAKNTLYLVILGILIGTFIDSIKNWWKS